MADPSTYPTEAGDTLDRVRAAADTLRADVRVGGTGAENQDFVDAIYGSFPLMIALIAVLTFLLLARAFRSLLLPLKAVLLNGLSIGAAWGVHHAGSCGSRGARLGSALWGIAPPRTPSTHGSR